MLLGAFVTAFYSFRLLYMTFFGEARWKHADAHHDAGHAHDDHGHDDHGHGHEPHESPWVVTLPLVLLAIPSAVVGFLTVSPMLFGTDMLDMPGAVLPRRDRRAARATSSASWRRNSTVRSSSRCTDSKAPAFWLRWAASCWPR